LDFGALSADLFEEFFLRLNSSAQQKGSGLRAAPEQTGFDELIEALHGFIAEANHHYIPAGSLPPQKGLEPFP